MALTNYYAQALVDHTFHGVAYTPPSQCYVALYTGVPTPDDPGVEVSGGSYARQEFNGVISTGGAGSTTTTTPTSFTSMPACNVVAVGITDDLTAGNLLIYETLDSPISLGLGDDLTSEAGTLSFFLD